MHETNRQHDIRACLARLATQYDRATSQHRMSATDREKMRCWFEDRYAYLQEEYRLAEHYAARERWFAARRAYIDAQRIEEIKLP